MLGFILGRKWTVKNKLNVRPDFPGFPANDIVIGSNPSLVFKDLYWRINKQNIHAH